MTTATTQTPIPDVIVALTSADRCDRCSSQAYVRATLPTGSALLFCGHHAHQHRASLVVAGASFHDETQKLTVVQESSFVG